MKRISLIIFGMLLLVPFSAFSQTEQYRERRQKLIKKQEATRAEIDEINRRINMFEERVVAAEEKYDRLYSQYEDLQRLIALQDQKISKLEVEQQHISEEIKVTGQEITENERQLQQLIQNYKETLRYVYKHGRTSQLAQIMSSESVNQMLVRAYYLNEFEEHRQEQAQQIKQTTQDLQENKKQLEAARDKNKKVLAEIRAEKKELARKKEEQEQNVKKLRENREQVEQRLAEVREQKQQLDETLTSLVLEEEKVRKAMEQRINELEAERKRKLAAAKSIENDAKRAQEMAKYSEPIEREDFITDERLNNLEQSFAKQKGQLRWPVESGTISEHFGRRRHPVYGTVTENLGIEIVTKPKDVVRVVHDGYVAAVQPLPHYGDVVIVRHGNYYTAYGNLSEVMVRKDAMLESGDVIGLSGDQNSARGESVFFMVREGRQNLNPEAWLANK